MSDMLRNQKRLEPLVSRHQKIGRISVRNHNETSYDSHGLAKIDENQQPLFMQSKASQGSRIGGSISIS